MKRQLWEVGKAYLAKQGIGEKQAGSLLGKWRRDFGDAEVIAALAAADAQCPSEPVEWIIGCLRRKKTVNGHAKEPERPKRPNMIVDSPEWLAAKARGDV